MSWCMGCSQSPCEIGNTEECAGRLRFATPPGPSCSRCGHELCPCCPMPWCDHLITGQPGNDEDETPHDRELCCEGACVVPWDCFLEWQAELKAEALSRSKALRISSTAEGPWFPAWARRARGAPCWQPQPVFQDAPAVVPLLAGVRVWQLTRGFADWAADGLIGPVTWAQRDDDLEQLARELAREMELADLGFTQLGRFLMRAGVEARRT